MTFDEYQAAARTTAVYPAHMKIVYPALGLAGEAGEVANKVKKIYRDGVPISVAGPEIGKEIADCLWYIAALASDLGLSLDAVARANVDKLAARKSSGTLKGAGDDR